MDEGLVNKSILFVAISSVIDELKSVDNGVVVLFVDDDDDADGYNDGVGDDNSDDNDDDDDDAGDDDICRLATEDDIPGLKDELPRESICVVVVPSFSTNCKRGAIDDSPDCNSETVVMALSSRAEL